MNYRRLGKSGVKVGEIGFGNWLTQGEGGVSADVARACVRRAFELGVNFFDTADIYRRGLAEEVFGRELKAFRRQDLVLATKLFRPMSDNINDRGLSRKHILTAIDESLRRLGTDYVDLYQIHRWDYHTSIEETAEALHDVVKSGKARYIGASSMHAWQFAKALHVAERHGWTRFASMQNHYNLIYREEEREMLPLCAEEGIAVIPWSPLARGFLAGNRTRQNWGETLRAKTDDYGQRLYYQERDFDVVERVREVARRKGVEPIQIALAWLLAKPAVTAPIVGVSKTGQLKSLLGAFEVSLDADDVRSIEECYKPHVPQEYR